MSLVVDLIVRNGISKGENPYFIDAVNRYFNVALVNDELKAVELKKEISEKRISDDNFNIKDTWAYYGTDTERIEIVYPLYEKRVQGLLKEFTGTSFQIYMKETQQVKYESGEIGKVSNGYQALVRLFLELIYYQETTLRSDEKKSEAVIDKIDEYLSPRSA